MPEAKQMLKQLDKCNNGDNAVKRKGRKISKGALSNYKIQKKRKGKKVKVKGKRIIRHTWEKVSRDVFSFMQIKPSEETPWKGRATRAKLLLFRLSPNFE